MNKKVWKYLALTVAILMATVSVSGCMSPEAVANGFVIGAKSDNFEMNEKQIDVYRYHVAQNQLYYEYMYIQWGIMQDPTDGMVRNGTWDATTYINYALPDYVGSSEFDASAYEYAKQYLAYCEGAKETGVYDQLKEQTAADVDEYVEGLEELAKSNNVSLSRYLTKWVGAGVGEKDVRAAMEYYYIAIAFADSLFAEFSDNITSEQIAAYVDENKASFYTTSIVSYKLANEAMKEKIETLKTAEEVKTYLVDYYMDQKFEAQYKTNITEKNIEDVDKDKTRADVRTTLLALNELGDAEAVFKSTDTDTYKKACYNIANTINSTVKTQVAAVAESDQKYSDATASTASDLAKWLFGDETRKAGDSTIIKTETKDKDGKVTATTYTWYVVEEHMILDTEKTKDMHYVWLNDEATADAFWTALNETKTPEKFAELVAEYAPGVSGEVNERLSYETVKSANEALAEWLYAEGRTEGDIYKIENKDTDGKVTGYYIAYFVQENEETWSLTAREAIASEQLDAWFENAVIRYSVQVDYTFEAETMPEGFVGNVVISPSEKENSGSITYDPSKGDSFIGSVVISPEGGFSYSTFEGNSYVTVYPFGSSTDGGVITYPSEDMDIIFDRFEVVTSEPSSDSFFGSLFD